jgi:hypothetical protein
VLAAQVCQISLLQAGAVADYESALAMMTVLECLQLLDAGPA